MAVVHRLDPLDVTLGIAYGEDEVASGTVAGNFVIQGRRNRGGFATIYRARHVKTGQPAAIKLLQSFEKRSALARFRRESRILNEVHHPNVVEMYECGWLPGGRPWIALQWLEGHDLAQELVRHGPYTVEDALPIVQSLCAALSAVHARGIVHRDVKTQNIMLSRGHVTLVDFGVAKIAHAIEPEAEVTMVGEAVGTPSTMSPEQFMSGSVDPRTDIYGLGVVLFQMLTGRPPFRGSTLTELQEYHLHSVPPRVSEQVGGPRAVDAVIRRCLAKERHDRYANVNAFFDDLCAAVLL